VAVTARPALDAQKLRADFPIFEQKIHGKPLAYLDSAASSQKPRQVLDVLRDFYETSYANVHRGVYVLSERATEAYEGAREIAREFVNAPSTREVIFTRSATESINLVAYAWGLDNLGPGDAVLVTELEHHSNFVPWQFIAKRTGADFRLLPIDDNGELRLEALDELADGVKVVATNYVSNSLGTVNPVAKLAAWAHERGAIMVVDAAQGAPHHRVDVQELGCDFLAFSSHKLCGPTGVGALWGRAELLEPMAPFNLGGHMIRSVRAEGTTWGELPYKFEAGTMPIAEAVGFGAAMEYVSSVGLEAILCNKPVHAFGDSSFAFILLSEDEAERVQRLAYYLLAYLVPFTLQLDPGYLRFRLAAPPAQSIILRHLEEYMTNQGLDDELLSELPPEQRSAVLVLFANQESKAQRLVGSLEKALEERDLEISSLRQSISWRVTAPLRWLHQRLIRRSASH